MHIDVGKVSHKEDMEEPGTTYSCWSCGAPTIAGQRFCHHCGSSLNNQQLKEQFINTTVLPTYPTESTGDNTQKLAGTGLSAPLQQSTPAMLTPESGRSGSMPDMIHQPITNPPILPLIGPTPKNILSRLAPKHISRRSVLAAGLGAAGILTLGGAASAYLSSNTGLTANNGAVNTIPIFFTCSTEKAGWMKAAVNAFHQSNPTIGNKTIQIELDLRGSLDAQRKILNGTIQPIILLTFIISALIILNISALMINAHTKRGERYTFMWTILATAHTTATTSRIWDIYLDVANWPRWDHGLALYRPDGPFAGGTSGILQPVGGPELSFTIIDVEEGHGFVDRTPIGPDHAIIGRHVLTSLAEGTQITHIIEIEGPDAQHLAHEMGFKQEELLDTVTSLARYAEEN